MPSLILRFISALGKQLFTIFFTYFHSFSELLFLADISVLFMKQQSVFENDKGCEDYTLATQYSVNIF